MSLADKIINNVRALPESKQIEVLDFIEYLRVKTDRQENTGWSDFLFYQQCVEWKMKNHLIH
jgi:hypothetical protein